MFSTELFATQSNKKNRCTSPEDDCTHEYPKPRNSKTAFFSYQSRDFLTLHFRKVRISYAPLTACL